MSIKDVWRELITMGYTGSYQPVRRWFYERRQLPAELIGLRVSPRHFSSLFIKDEANLNEQEKLIVTTLDALPELAQLRADASQFREALLGKKPDEMKAWLDTAAEAAFSFAA